MSSNKKVKQVNSTNKKEKPELTSQEFISSLISEKMALLQNLNDQVDNLENVINVLKTENKTKLTDDDYNVLLTIRRNLIYKSIKTFDANKYANTKKLITYFDDFYNITSDKLMSFDMKM